MDGEIKTDNLFYYFWREVLNIQLYASQILEILKKIYWYSKFKHMIPNSTTSYLYGRSSQLNCITRRHTIAVTSRIHITRRNDRYTYCTAMHQAIAFPLDPGGHTARRRQRSFVV